ncbi:hypothetical protein [Lentzea sp. HUAS12]|uniref:hypothetical protein n=1 Tax=Lentzea sp. HUAS12 TaxID=2951806 RepID=UPI00209FCA5A|nr:hypothetical protein [Lentzea sp. HUAS12]USX54640.1 hypothetical protein ND450_11195 [Lentzea sp. HUAS12]
MQIQHATHSTPALPAHGLFSHPDVVSARTTAGASPDEGGRSYAGLFREPADPAPHPGAAG